MKFSITIEIPRPAGKERQSGAETVKKAAKQLGKAAAKGFEAAKKQIPKLRELADSISDEIKTDIAAVRDRDPAARNDAEVLLRHSAYMRYSHTAWHTSCISERNTSPHVP